MMESWKVDRGGVVGADSKEEIVGMSEETRERDQDQVAKLFPDEIWMMVLNKVDGKGKEAASNAYPYFRKRLSKQRVEFLFPQVWDILVLRIEGNNKNEIQRFEPKERYWPSCVLSMREVSKTWCSTIDRFYGSIYYFVHSHFREMGSMEFGEYRVDDKLEDFTVTFRQFDDRICCYYHMDAFPKRADWGMNYHELEDIMEHFDATHLNTNRNPLLCRTIVLEACCEGPSPSEVSECQCPDFRRIKTFLEKYGHHVWYCKIDMRVLDKQRKSRVLSTIKEWLELMPNLKLLNWDMPYYRDYGMEDVIRLPKLVHLKSVHFRHVPLAFQHAIFISNDHVEEYIPEVSTRCHVFSVGVPFVNLKQLTIRFENVEDIERLENHRESWALEKITVAFYDSQLPDLLVWRRVFRLLERWKETLTSLVMSIPCPTIEEKAVELIECEDMKVDLPHVKFLRLQARRIDFIKFFTPLKKLELLEVKETDVEQRESEFDKRIREQTRKEGIFNGHFEGDLHFSNIWHVFPALRRVDLIYSEKGPFLRRYATPETLE